MTTEYMHFTFTADGKLYADGQPVLDGKTISLIVYGPELYLTNLDAWNRILSADEIIQLQNSPRTQSR